VEKDAIMKSEFLTNASGQVQEDAKKAWAYVGRFLWGFAVVESVINEIFIKLFNLKGASLIFLGSPSLDLRKKLELIRIVLDLRGEKTDIFGRMHSLLTIRNVVAHRAFGLDGDGIDFDYVDNRGKLVLPEKIRSTTGETIISFGKLDSYDSQLAQLFDSFDKLLASTEPVTDLAPDVQAEIERVIDQSDNVLRFPRC
jgi:hypothetical protein